MTENLCPKCHKAISAADAAFCPFCGEKLQTGGVDVSAVLNEPNPVKKHELLLKLKEEHPDSPEVAEEILHLGRLYERGKKGGDFTIIKCFVLNVYLEPKALSKKQRDALHGEIFDHPDLEAYLALSGDRPAALRRYLTRLSEDFIRLFLKGSSQHMRMIFGYINRSKAPKYLALPASQMLAAMQRDEALTDEQRTMLMQAFYEAFARQMDRETKYLDEMLSKHKIVIETP